MLELRRRWIAQELLLPNTLDGAAKGAKVYWDPHASGVGFYTNLTSRKNVRKNVQVSYVIIQWENSNFWSLKWYLVRLYCD